MTWEEARVWRASRDGRVVFTNGVFDIIHPGHVDVLTGARTHGDALIVGVNTDASVKRLKGPTRPVRSEAERAYVLAAMDALRPDVIAKGGDYSEGTIVGAKEVKEWGGEAVVIPLTPGQSTTSILEKLSER
jgi:D-beta-D-heptose 7-phosphate kinase/D-beta-D-heptose 1-phosphate adenosyltransferase